MAPGVKSGFLVLLLLVLGVGAQVEIKYFEIGGTLVLDPKVSEPLTSLTWKHRNNIVAEWIKDKVKLEYLGDFKGRSEVDLTTGILTIRGIKKAEGGEFKVEINSRELPGTFKAVGIRNLEEVTVVVAVRPLTCSAASETCSLDCGGDFTDAEPARFFWREGETGPWEEKTKTITIFNNEETKKIDSFSCKASNPLGETKESKAEKNPLTQEEPGGGSGGAIAAAIIVVLVLVLAVGAIVLLYFKWWLPRRHANGQSNRGHEAGSGNNGMDHSSSTPMLMEEGKGQTRPASADPNSLDGQKPGEADPSAGDVSTVYSAVGSLNPEEPDQSEVPRATENPENEPGYENSPTPNAGS